MDTQQATTVGTDALVSVRGKSVLITGGSRGNGLMMARGFVEGGAEVYISSRKAEACEAAAAELREAGTCFAIPADVSEDAGQDDLAAAVIELSGKLDVLINNAGTAWGAPVEEYPLTAFDKLFDVNTKAIFALTQKLLGPLRAASRPGAPSRVINIGSIDGIRVPIFDNFAYSASKAAVHMLSQHLASVLAPEITVNAIAPGPFISKMTEHAFGSGEGYDRVVSKVPMGRMGQPADAAGLAMFLAGPAASWITGTVITLDGGLTLGY
jgi:NAD(P)-dependent dehydrogenase (short-subunit alcohol dehydrogenase family)